MNEPKMKIGYGVFGRAYEQGFKNELHQNDLLIIHIEEQDISI